MVNRKKSCDRLTSNVEGSLPLFSIDGGPTSVPAAGNRNGTSLNNAGENGNYWSSTPNEDNDNNAYYLNFNSGNFDWNNNWNRNNGHSVRPVREITRISQQRSAIRHFVLTREQLLLDLYRAYKDARKHKRGKNYQLAFEERLEENLVQLRNELYDRTYTPLPSTCFIIHDPKMREVFAAEFRDRIVHHLFYNYTYELFYRTFIADSYSCIKERGTHYGIERLKHHIRSVSSGYSRPCFVLKIDIRGYFMHIDRNLLLTFSRDTLRRMKNHAPPALGKKWSEVIDYDFVDYLLKTIIEVDPLKNCRRLGTLDDWGALPSDKSLFCADNDCGLPIGNLSSQLFSNIYLNVFDQFVKRNLGCRHYGRYVDDAFVVSEDKAELQSLILPISTFLKKELKLTLNPKKLMIVNAYYGVEFLGAFIKPFRTYVSNSTLARMSNKIRNNKYSDFQALRSSFNSFLGVFSHYDSYCVRKLLFSSVTGINDIGTFSSDYLKFQ